MKKPPIEILMLFTTIIKFFAKATDDFSFHHTVIAYLILSFNNIIIKNAVTLFVCFSIIVIKVEVSLLCIILECSKMSLYFLHVFYIVANNIKTKDVSYSKDLLFSVNKKIVNAFIFNEIHELIIIF